MSDALAIARKSSILLQWRSLALLLALVIALTMAVGKFLASRGAITVIAAKTLVDGQVITGLDVREARVMLPAEASRLTLTRAQAAIGRRVSGRIAAGEPVTSTRLMQPGEHANTASMTIPLSDADAALVAAGDLINVYASDDAVGTSSAALIAGRVEVVSVNHSSDRFSRSGSTAVVFVNPQQALALASHAHQSQLSISLVVAGAGR